MGRFLEDRITKVLAADQVKEIDVVMPVPESSITNAPVVAARLNKPYCQGFIKIQYVSRDLYNARPKGAGERRETETHSCF